MNALTSKNISRVQTLLGFHKHLDLNYHSRSGVTALICAVIISPHAVHSLIQLGADVNIKTCFRRNVYGPQTRREVKMMLLFAGIDPERADPDGVIKNYVRNWLSGLEYAKKRFRSIFDNEMLEKTVCEFIFNEEFLRKVL